MASQGITHVFFRVQSECHYSGAAWVKGIEAVALVSRNPALVSATLPSIQQTQHFLFQMLTLLVIKM